MVQVSVIIINYNSHAFTAACLQSIQQHTAANLTYEIIVVDNNSELEDYRQLELVCKQNDRVKLIRSILNLGFSGGNMVGLQAATGAYIYFLNNDCELLNDNLSQLYQFMQGQPGAGACTGQMYYGNLAFHPSFGYFPTVALRLLGSGLLRFFSPASYPAKQKKYEQPLAVPLITGAAMFVDREKLAEIGGFDINYFLYCEEEDLCWRLRRQGYGIYLVPRAQFKHHMGKSTIRNFPIELENYISLLYYHRKFNSYPSYLVLKLVYFLKNIRKVFRNLLYFKLAIYILLGAPLKYSLKHKQKLRFIEDLPT